jgi:hypothetical protein
MAARSNGEANGPWTGLGRPAWAHPGPVACLLRVASVPESSRSFPLLHVGSCRQFLSELDVAPCPARFGTFLGRSSEFVIFSGLVPGLLGVEFASLHDLYGASRSLLTVNSCIKVRLDLQAYKSPIVVKGPFFPRVANPRYRICGTNV